MRRALGMMRERLVYGNPLGMLIGRILVHGVRIDARHHVHSELPCSLNQRANGSVPLRYLLT